MYPEWLHSVVGWRTAHKWTGWHYAAVRMRPDHVIGLVREDGDGRPYMYLYRDHIDLKTTKKEWFPLTFSKAALVGNGQ